MPKSQRTTFATKMLQILQEKEFAQSLELFNDKKKRIAECITCIMEHKYGISYPPYLYPNTIQIAFEQSIKSNRLVARVIKEDWSLEKKDQFLCDMRKLLRLFRDGKLKYYFTMGWGFNDYNNVADLKKYEIL